MSSSFAINFATSFAALEALSAVTTTTASEDPTQRNVIISNATWAIVYEVIQALKNIPGSSIISDADPIFAEIFAPIVGSAAAETALYYLDKHQNIIRDVSLGDAIMRFTAVNLAKAIL